MEAIGATPIRYQWYFDGRPLFLATNATLKVCHITEASAGDCTVVITNGRSAASVVAHLSLFSDTNPPAINCPADRTVVACSPGGRSVTFPAPGLSDDLTVWTTPSWDIVINSSGQQVCGRMEVTGFRLVSLAPAAKS